MSTLMKAQTQFNLAFRSLKSAPGFVASVMVTMSLTLATLFVIFSLVNTYFLKPLNVLDEDRLFVIEQEVDTAAGTLSGYQSYKAIIHWYKTQNSFEKLTPVNPNNFILTNLPGEPKVVASFTMPDYFEILKVPMLLGQSFDKGMPLEQVSNSVVISEVFWQKHFDRSPDVIGKTLNDGVRSFNIIGVVAKSFEPPYMFYSGKTDIWLNFGADQRYFNNGEWDNPWDNTYKSLKLIGIAKQGFSQASIFKDLDEQIEDIRAEWLEGYEASTDFRPLVTPYRIIELGDKGHLSLFLLAGTVGLLLIAIVNVCNLFFSRALAQHKTLALQAVLGAKRRLLFSAILTQTLILMTSSVAVALFLSAWGIKLFKQLAMGKLPLVQSLSIDINLLAVAIGLSFLLAYLFALVTSRLVDYKALKNQLQSSGKGSVNQVSARTVKVLIATQMTFASVLIIFACLALTKTHQTLERPMGSKVDNMYYAGAYINGENGELSITERFDKIQKIKQLLEQLPQVEKVSSGRSPVSLQITKSTLTDMDGKITEFIPQAWVGSQYFEHTGLKILKGRAFSDKALRGEKNEVMVTQSLAYLLDPNADVIGKVYEGHDPKNEIVGITEDFNHPNYFDQDKGKHIWWPSQPFGYNLIVETKPGFSLNQESLLLALRKEDARFKMWQFISLSEEYDRIIYMDMITLYLSYILAAFTLLLASVGIYGVLSYNLGLRRFEFGIRMALGAKKAKLYKLLVKEAVMPLLIGVIIANLITLIIYNRFYQKLSLWLTFDISFALPAILISTSIAIYASIRPMQKIIQARPMKALRNE
ncbi:MAG: FtsX-like permease family protein [Colwellia sp.]|nr:FtsX-like permease family protein [Colwellia sp.]